MGFADFNALFFFLTSLLPPRQNLLLDDREGVGLLNTTIAPPFFPGKLLFFFSPR